MNGSFYEVCQLQWSELADVDMVYSLHQEPGGGWVGQSALHFLVNLNCAIIIVTVAMTARCRAAGVRFQKPRPTPHDFSYQKVIYVVSIANDRRRHIYLS